MQQKKDEFKRQEHRILIDLFIAVLARITNSGHQMEIQLFKYHFYKVDRESLTVSWKWYYKKEGGNI